MKIAARFRSSTSQQPINEAHLAMTEGANSEHGSSSRSGQLGSGQLDRNQGSHKRKTSTQERLDGILEVSLWLCSLLELWWRRNVCDLRLPCVTKLMCLACVLSCRWNFAPCSSSSRGNVASRCLRGLTRPRLFPPADGPRPRRIARRNKPFFGPGQPPTAAPPRRGLASGA